MEMLISVGQFLIANKAVILGACFAVSEVLALIPSVKANGIFQMLLQSLMKLKGPSA